MKTGISIPDDLFQAADRLAAQLGLTRSELYQRAIVAYLQAYDDRAVTETLNRIYGVEQTATVDPVLDALQQASLEREPW